MYSDYEDEQPFTPAGKSDMGDHDSSTDEGVIDPIPRKKTLSTNDLVETDLQTGFEVVSSMTVNQLNELITKLESVCTPIDTYSVHIRTKKVKWETVAFDIFSADDCRVAWLYLKQQARRFRIMHEVIREIKQETEQDIGRYRARLIETAPGYPKKPPPTAATLFVREMWKANPENKKINFLIFQRECLEEFQKFDEKTQKSWQKKLEDANTKYDQNVKEFYAKYPNYNYKDGKQHRTAESVKAKTEKVKAKAEKGKEKPGARPRITTTVEQSELFPDAPRPPLNPQGEFIQSKISKLNPVPTGTRLTELKQKYKEKWNNLSDRKKSKWILHTLEHIHNYCEELQEYQIQHPGYITRPLKVRNHLTKADIDLWAYMNGQPEKPANHVFDHFYKQKCTEPEYENLTEKESRRLAEEEYKTLDTYDRELWKINFRKSVLEYKKNIERFFEWTPDMLKPHILYRVPKKYQSVIITHVEKIPAKFVLEEEEKAELMLQQHQDELEDEEYGNDPLAEPESPSKKTKKSKHGSDTKPAVIEDPVSKKKTKRKLDPELVPVVEPEPKKHKRKKKHSTEDDTDDIEVEGDKVMNGRIKDKDHTKRAIKEEHPLKAKYTKKPQPNDYVEGLMPTTRDIDDVIRGIYDARPQLGRNYSVFYYYARYVATNKAWISQHRKVGLVESAKMIFQTFLTISNHKKNLFIHQSWEWHESTKALFSYHGKIKHGMLLPGEPVPPAPNAWVMYQREKYLLGQITKERLPSWLELKEEGQLIYMKKLYRATKQYANDYEEYLMKLSPEEFATYVLFQSKNWERRVLQSNPLRAAWRGYIFPLPTDKHGTKDDYGGGEESDTEIFEPDIFRTRVDNKRLHIRLPSVLDNDKFIKDVVKDVEPEELSIEEMMAIADESSDEEV